MNKKKSIWAFVLAFMLIMPAMFLLSACGGHKHSFAQEWSKDGEYHWHACTGEGCSEVDSKAKHVYTNDGDADCNICGYERTPAENAITLTVKPRTYNGKPQGLVEGEDYTVTHGTASISYREEGTSNFLATPPTDAGTYTVRIVVVGNAVHKSTYKEIELKIEKFDLNTLVANTEETYYSGGKQTEYEKSVFEKGHALFGDKIYVKYTFEDTAVNAISTKAELITKNDDAAVVNNYTFDATKTCAKIVPKLIRLGNGTKDREFKLSDTLDGGFTAIALDINKFYFIEGEEVYLVVNKTYSWETGAKIPLVYDSKDYKLGENELVTLGGAHAGNYALCETGTATYTKAQVKLTFDMDSNYPNYNFGTGEEKIVYGEKSFVVGINPNNDWTEIIFSEENKNKNVKIRIWDGGSTLIAEIERKCTYVNGNLVCEYVGGVIDLDGSEIRFDLIQNLSGYTDELGRWIVGEAYSMTVGIQIYFPE